MKYLLEWHKRCLSTQESYLHRRNLEMANLRDNIERDRISIQIYKAQIERAEREQKISFDRDKFNKKRS